MPIKTKLTMRALADGNDGEQSYKAKDTIETNAEHAARCVARGSGELLDKNGRKVPRAKALQQLAGLGLRGSAAKLVKQAADTAAVATAGKARARKRKA